MALDPFVHGCSGRGPSPNHTRIVAASAIFRVCSPWPCDSTEVGSPASRRLPSAIGSASHEGCDRPLPIAVLGSEVPSVVSVVARPPAGSRLLRPDPARGPTRSAFVVSHHLDGLRHRDRRGLVASLERPWGSPRFTSRPPLIRNGRDDSLRCTTLQSVSLSDSLQRVTAPSCPLAVADSRPLDLGALLRRRVRGRRPRGRGRGLDALLGFPCSVARSLTGDPMRAPTAEAAGRPDPSEQLPRPAAPRGSCCQDLAVGRGAVPVPSSTRPAAHPARRPFCLVGPCCVRATRAYGGRCRGGGPLPRERASSAPRRSGARCVS